MTETRLGEKVTVILRARSLGADDIPNAVIVDMLPGGFEVEMSPARFKQTDTSEAGSEEEGAADSSDQTPIFGFGEPGSSFAPDYADVREDRVLLFGTIPRDRSVEFRYTLTPTNKGTFIAPPVYGESMYDRSLFAVFPGGKVTVHEAEPTN